MATKKHTEYLDILGSMDRNTTRRAFLHLGRYHGFDLMSSVSGLGVEIGHTTYLSYIDNTNTPVDVGVFVTGHGVVITVAIADTIPTLTPLANASADDVYQIVYAEYTWADSASHGSVSYGIDSVLTTIPTTPTGLTDVQTPIGYVTIAAGGTAYSDLTWTPYPIPNLAGKADIDLSICALLAGPNKFTGFNSWSEVDIAKTALTANVGVGGAPYYDLNLTEDANVFRVAALDPGDYTIVNIVFTEGRVVVDGDVLYLKFDSCAATLTWETAGNFRPHPPYNVLSLSSYGGLYKLVRTNGKWEFFSMITNVFSEITSLASRVTTNETEIASHGQRLGALESSGAWVNLVPLGTSGSNNWTIDYLQTSVRGDFTYIKGSFSISAGASAGLTEILSLVIGSTYLQFCLTQLLGTTGVTTVSSVAALVIDNGDGTVKIKHADLVPTVYTYVLPPCILS